MATPLDRACCARLPATALCRLAPLRARPDVRVLLRGAEAWAFWHEGDGDVARQALALAGAELFERRDGRWHRLAHHLPAFDVPDAAQARPLAALLFPAPVEPDSAPDDGIAPLPLSLVRDSRPRRATALRCPLAELVRWADGATSHQFVGLSAARCDADALVRGERLPPIAGAERFWGSIVLVPLGWRPEPELAEGVLAAALGLDGEVALLGPEGAERVPESAFGPVTRAGARLALREGEP